MAIEPMDAAGVAKLRQNGTKKVRLINVWATWCAPCVAEFPELVKTARKFGLRDFELITISLDEAEQMAKAKAFLESKHVALPDKVKASLKAEARTTNNYLYQGASQDDLVKALDPEWPGPIPHTVSSLRMERSFGGIMAPWMAKSCAARFSTIWEISIRRPEGRASGFGRIERGNDPNRILSLHRGTGWNPLPASKRGGFAC